MSLFKGHWYTKDGKPFLDPVESALFVADKDLLPSVTTVLKICANPALQNWIQGQRDKAWFEIGRDPQEDFTDLVKRVNAAASSESTGAKSKGSFVHAIFERYWNFIKEGNPYVNVDKRNQFETDVVKTIKEIHDTMLQKFTPTMIEEIVVAKEYAGQVDLAGIIANTKVIIDLKTQTVKKGRTFCAYPNYWAQVAAYAKATSATTAFIVMIDPATMKWKLEMKEGAELNYFFRIFSACLTLFKSPMGIAT